MKEDNKPNSDEARDSLDSIEIMKNAGYRLAVPHRWFGAGIAFFIGSLFALYALEDPYPYIVFPIVGFGVFIIAARESIGAYGREYPGTKANKWALALFMAVMILIFFSSIYIRRAYDLAWVPIIVGLLVGLVVVLISESERRAILARAGAKQLK